jgi:hypothetical protein
VLPLRKRIEFRDFLFVTLLALISSVPLIALRYSALLESKLIVRGIFAAVGIITLAWLACCRANRAAAPSPRESWWVRASAAALLAVVTLVTFFLPLCKHYWGGCDEFVAYTPMKAQIWSEPFDKGHSRPLTGLAHLAGHALAGGRIEGFLAVAGLLCWGSGLLLWAILRRVLPQAPAVCFAAAVLYVCNRADPLRLYPQWASNFYGAAVCLLLLAVWLFLISFERQSRAGLFAACLALGGAFLTNEGVFPVSLTGLGLLWIVRGRGGAWLSWAYAWLATTSLFAVRFVLFLVQTSDSYQMRQLKAEGASSRLMGAQFLELCEPLKTYFKFNKLPQSYWLWALPVLAAVAVGLWIMARRQATLPSSRVLLWSMALAAAGILLGICPFLHLQGAARTQFYAAPCQATLIAVAVSLICRHFPRRTHVLGFAVVIAALAANLTAKSHHAQDTEYRPLTFDKLVHAFQQLHSLSPRFKPQTLVLVVLDKEQSGTLGIGYALREFSEMFLGAVAAQVNHPNDPFSQIAFEQESIRLMVGRYAYVFGYDEVVAFRLGVDGTLYYEAELPSECQPPEGATGYAPAERFCAGPLTPLPYLNYPAWSGPLDDVVPVEEGILLGRGWSPLWFENGFLFREAQPEAELVINSLGECRRELLLDVEAPPTLPSGAELQVIDTQDRVLTKAAIEGRGAVRLEVPLPPDRVSLVRLKLQAPPTPNGQVDGTFRLYSQTGPLDRDPRPRESRGILVGNLRFGKGWYPLETYRDETFRWVNTDAELVPGRAPGNKPPSLALDLQPGPGLAGQPCVIELVGDDGEVLSTADIAARGRQRVTFELPKVPAPGARLLLRVVGGGHRIPSDPRILNVRVFTCEWH